MAPPKSSAPLDENSLYQAAVKALARRARSSGEIRLLLAKKKAKKQDIDAVLKRLRENGYLDDARFARAFAAGRMEADLHGKARVRRDLLARRVHPEVVQQAVQSAYENVDERKLLREYLRRKVRLQTVTPKAPTPKAFTPKASAVASLYRRLLRAGFRSDTIVRELQGLLQGLSQGMSRGASLQGRREMDPEQWQQWLDSLSEVPEPEADA